MSSKLSILRPYYSMLIKEFLCFMLCFSGGCHNRRSIILKGTVEKRRKWGFSLENQIIRDQSAQICLVCCIKTKCYKCHEFVYSQSLKTDPKSSGQLLIYLISSSAGQCQKFFVAERKCTFHLDCPNLTLYFHMIQRQNNKMCNFWQNFLFLS